MDKVKMFLPISKSLSPLGCQGWVVIPQNVKKSLITRGGQRYFFGGCAFARILPFFLRPLALDRNDFKFASALGAIPL